MSAVSRRLLIVVGLLLVMAMSACSAPMPAAVEESALTQTLPPCPKSPNCVSTEAPREDTQHFIEPIPYTGSAAEARQQLLDVIAAMPRTEIVTAEESYLHATFTSQVFRFVDDVQFVIDDASKMIHFRSAARLGQGDMGVNRDRMEEIRTRFTQAAAP
jgi:uncharacterized protein (DUF1499 family)